MEKKNDLEDYWNELNVFQQEATKNSDELLEQESEQEIKQQLREEGEDEAEWLKDVGFGHLTDTFREGREISENDVTASVGILSKHQIDAVNRRVRLLNQTLKNRYRQQRGRHRKPDIRDVFKDIETSSTGTRSRSATPDSLDSEEENASSAEWSGSRDLLSTASPIVSVPATIKPTQEASNPVRPSHELFTRPGHYWSMHRVDVASDTEGIELLGYQRFGTIHGLHWGVRHRSGSVPTVSLSALDLQTSSVPNVPLLPIRNENAVSFEGFFGTTQKSSDQRELESDSNSLEMLHISDKESSILRPLLWLELSAIFDKHSIPCRKRMPYKRKRKENGNVFGVSLSTLVMRDRRIHIDNSTVPQIFQMILNELEVRWCKEEGILRIAGHKQRVETLCAQIEANFYTKPDEIRACLEKSTCHELTSILKRLLRELPQPLLTSELIELFYQCQQLVGESQARALNLLVLLLPIEHSGTLRILISFLDAVIRNDKLNKMSLHNVAMIMAPSMFPPRAVQVPCRSVHQTDISIQVKMAAVCCHLVEMLLTSGFDLWKIPSTLWLQHQTRNFHPEKPSRPKEPLHRSNTNFVSVGSNKPKDRFI